MSASVLLDPAPVHSGSSQNETLCSGVTASRTLSLQASSNEERSVESGDTDSRSLANSDFRKESSAPTTPGTSPSLTSLAEGTPQDQPLLTNDSPKKTKLRCLKHSNLSPNAPEFSQDEYLQFIEPTPVFPPSYDSLPPGGCPKFPVIDNISCEEKLPQYAPAAYKLGVVSRKLEWLSPYEPSPARSWKALVIELNSTQLNFYHIPSSLETLLLGFASDYAKRDDSHLSGRDSLPEIYRSVVTTAQDVQFQQLCDRLEFFKHENYNENSIEDGYISSASVSNTKSLKNNKNKRLIRSYSLQHARIGLASDYTKKANVLRLRLESEQFLLNFASAQDLIDWNLGLSVGRDVAMDLIERDIPRYRTVPRRRRSHIIGYTPFYHDAIARRSRAHSDSQFETSSRLSGRFSKLKNKISSLSLNNWKGVSNPGQKSVQHQQLQQVKQFRQAVKSSMADTYAPVGSVSSMSIQRELNRQSGGRSNSIASFSIVGTEDEDDAEEQFGSLASHLDHSDNHLDDGDEDIQNFSDLHRSDDEDVYEVDLDEFPDQNIDRSPRVVPQGPSYSIGDHKWRPLKKQESDRRFTRNCLKCIKPLTFDESWVNKLLMKPAAVSPLSSAYLRNQFFTSGISSKGSSSSSLMSLAAGSSSDLSSLTNLSPHKRKSSFQKESIFNFSDTSLARVTNHNLKEYVVGSHSLIPRDV